MVLSPVYTGGCITSVTQNLNGINSLCAQLVELQPKQFILFPLNFFQIIELLIGLVESWYINVNAKNFQDQTALEMFKVEPCGDQDLAKKLRRVGREPKPTVYLSPSQFLSMKLSALEKFTLSFGIQGESARSMILVVATLITTATYQAALTPPGGYWGDNSSNPPANSTVVTANSSGIAVEKPHQAGKIILTGSDLYLFTAFNGMIFLASIITIWITAIPLLPDTLPVCLLIWILSGAYFASATSGFPKSDVGGASIIVVSYMCLLLVGLVAPMIFVLWLNYKKSKVRLQIHATGRLLGEFLKLKEQK